MNVFRRGLMRLRYAGPFLLLLLAPVLGGAAVAAAPQATTSAYQAWMLSCLDALQADLPEISASAEAAADLYINQSFTLLLAGAPGFVSEAYGRAGGMMPIESIKWWRRPTERAVVLYALREEALPDDYAILRRLVGQGCHVILFARRSLLDEALRQDIEGLEALDTHAAAQGGLFQSADDEWVVPTDPIARMVAEWTWIGEFVAACTRQGRMPTMWKSNGAEGGMDWNNLYQRPRRRYHETAPPPVPPGQLGRAYLDAVRTALRTLYANEVGRIVQVADWAMDARAAGRTVYTFSNGHGPLLDPGGPHDPRYFRQLSTDEYTVDPTVTLAAGDVILYIGQGGMPVEWGSFQGRDLPGDWRRAGVKVAWSFGNLWTREFCRQISMIQPEEPFLDQHFAYADASVWIEGYPLGILPTSGITSEAVLWLATAELHGRLQPAPAPE